MDNEPVTKADLNAAVGDLNAKVGDLNAKVGDLNAKIEDLSAAMFSAMAELRSELKEAIRDSQTEILRGLEVFIRAADARMQRLELGAEVICRSDVLLNTRLSAVETRLLEIEKKLLT